MGGNQLVLVKSIRQMLFFVCFLITIFHLLPFFPHFAPAAAAMEPGEGPRPPQARGDGDVPTDPRPGEGVFFWGGGGEPQENGENVCQEMVFCGKRSSVVEKQRPEGTSSCSAGKTAPRRWSSAGNPPPWWTKYHPGDVLLHDRPFGGAVRCSSLENIPL